MDLHDALLLGFRLGWDDGTCIVDLRHATLGSCCLTFSAVSHLVFPRRRDWGPSSSIHAFSQAGNGQYEIEMQSGDVIRVEAADVALTTGDDA